jgi:hypothetical protein
MQERRTKQLVLISAQLDQQPPAGPEQASGRRHDPTYDVQAVTAAVECAPGFVAPGVGRQQAKITARDERSNGGHDVERPGPQRLTEVADHAGHPIASCARDRGDIDVDPDDRGGRDRGPQVGGDRPATGAEIDGPPSLVREERRRPAGELFAVDARHVDARSDRAGPATEPDRPGDPGQWLTVGPPRDPRFERCSVVCRGEQFGGLLLGRDTAGGRQSGDDRLGPPHRHQARAVLGH